MIITCWKQTTNNTHRHNTHLSSLFKHWTSLGRMPELIRSSIGGLRSLDNNFLQTRWLKQHINTHCQHGNHNPKKINLWLSGPTEKNGINSLMTELQQLYSKSKVHVWSQYFLYWCKNKANQFFLLNYQRENVPHINAVSPEKSICAPEWYTLNQCSCKSHCLLCHCFNGLSVWRWWIWC